MGSVPTDWEVAHQSHTSEAAGRKNHDMFLLFKEILKRVGTRVNFKISYYAAVLNLLFSA